MDRALHNPKTTIHGLLTIVLVFCTAMAKQGITLGTIGTGSVVALIAAIASGLTLVLSRDAK